MTFPENLCNVGAGGAWRGWYASSDVSRQPSNGVSIRETAAAGWADDVTAVLPPAAGPIRPPSVSHRTNVHIMDGSIQSRCSLLLVTNGLIARPYTVHQQTAAAETGRVAGPGRWQSTLPRAGRPTRPDLAAWSDWLPAARVSETDPRRAHARADSGHQSTRQAQCPRGPEGPLREPEAGIRLNGQ